MRKRPRAGALNVSKPRLGEWRLRDYLYYQLNGGETLERPHGAPEKIATRKVPRSEKYEVGLVAATQVKADRLLALIERAMHKHLPKPRRQRFTAFGLDQAWRPRQLFDEIHWLNDELASQPPLEILLSLGHLLHIHLHDNCCATSRPGSRTINGTQKPTSWIFGKVSTYPGN